jgi:hypothetical protein
MEEMEQAFDDDDNYGYGGYGGPWGRPMMPGYGGYGMPYGGGYPGYGYGYPQYQQPVYPQYQQPAPAAPQVPKANPAPAPAQR